TLLEVEAALAGALSDRFHAAVIEITAAVEAHAVDALVLGPRGDLRPDHLARLDLAFAGGIALRDDLLVERGNRHDRAAGEIVHQLRIDMVEAPVHGEA